MTDLAMHYADRTGALRGGIAAAIELLRDCNGNKVLERFALECLQKAYEEDTKKGNEND